MTCSFWKVEKAISPLRFDMKELTSGSPLAKVKMGWRSASLRQHPGRRQASLEMQLGDSSTSPRGGAETEPPTPPRKSNWEVIEHFNTSSTSSIRGRPTHSSSLIAVRTLACQLVVVIQVGGAMHSSSLNAARTLTCQQVGMSRGASIKEEEEDEEAADCEAGNLMNGDRRAPRDVQGDVESILLMTSNTNAGASWSQLRRLLHRLCRSHRFKNLEVLLSNMTHLLGLLLALCLVEMLYQRYFLRMNQSNMTHLLGLLLALCLVLGLLQMAAIFVSDPRDNNNILLHTQDDPSSIPPEVIAIGMTLTCCITVYGGLMAILSRPALNELYLLGVSYVVLATFLALEMTLTSANERRTPSTGVWAAMFFIYLTYALLPIRLQEAAGAGTLLGVSQVVLSAYLNVENRHLLRQVRAVIWLSQHTLIASGKDGDLVTATTYTYYVRLDKIVTFIRMSTGAGRKIYSASAIRKGMNSHVSLFVRSCRHPSPPLQPLLLRQDGGNTCAPFFIQSPSHPLNPPSTRADNEHEQLPNAMPPLREEDIKRVEE
uniref:Adenylate cyclase N-terminal domain-containing protein n=1 Tax=Timema bartmani TaxID=61472 RepID=A0A7R9ESG4_9NEOP|nr:unnamed protein product [Timema bartmani]